MFPGITSGKSLMKIIKNNGPNKEPWCKPEGMTDHWGRIFTLNDNLLFSFGQVILTPVKQTTRDAKIVKLLQKNNMWNSIECLGRLARNTTSTCGLSPKAFFHWWCVITNWVAHKQPSTNLCYQADRKGATWEYMALCAIFSWHLLGMDINREIDR